MASALALAALAALGIGVGQQGRRVTRLGALALPPPL